MEVIFDLISVFCAKIKQILKYTHALQPGFAQECEEMAASLYPCTMGSSAVYTANTLLLVSCLHLYGSRQHSKLMPT